MRWSVPILCLFSLLARSAWAEAPTEPPVHGWYAQAEAHGSFFSDVGDRSVIQNTFGYGVQGGYRWDDWGAFARMEHNIWLASEFSRDLNRGAFNIGVGVEHLYFSRRMRASLALGPSVLLFNTEIDNAGTTGFFVDLRPAALRWEVADGFVIQWDPITLTIVAPVLSGIPLVMLEYRTALAVEFDFSETIQ